MSWVENKVPYCQCNSDCCGKCPFCGSYRCDCSGLVAYAWNTRPGLTTHNLGSVSHRISVADLEVGDVLLNAKDHVIMFNGWVDRAKLQYHALQEAGCYGSLPHVASNTVGTIPGAPYVPMRFNGVVNSSVAGATAAERAKWQEKALLPLPTEDEENELLAHAAAMAQNGTWKWTKAIGEQ